MSAHPSITTPERPLLHICYAPADHGWVHGRMLPALGLTCEQYRTRADDHLGEPQLAEIARAVEQCRFTVLIASSATRWDRLAQFAADLAQQVTAEHHAARFFVVTREAAPGSEAARAQLPLALRARVGLDCSDEPHTVDSLARLRRLLALEDPVAEAPPCPYPGLERFTAANRHLLFGRGHDRDAVLHRIRAGHTRLLVLGPSGSGKSSLIHAAVLPALRADQHLVRVVPRGGDLASALRLTIEALEVPGAGAAFDRYLAAAGTGDERARLRTALVPDARRRVVVVDPLEEIFADDDPDARATLFQLLAGLWSLPWCTVILCMRADFYGALMTERCWRELEHHQHAVTPLDEIGLRAAIVEPARYAGVHVEAALVERLIREGDRDRSSVPLPLLQVALKELWERLTWRYLTLESYERILSRDQRGLAAALAMHADRVIQGLTEPGDRELAQRILLDLVHLGEGRPHTRRRRTLEQLRRSGDASGQLERVLDTLIDGRLVVTSSGDGAAARSIDLAHDVLISGWAALAAWVQDRQADMVKHRRIERWAREWVEAGRASGLLDEASTAEARAWRDCPGGRALGVSERLVELIEASEAANARARRDKEAMIARLLEEEQRTRRSIAAAAQVAHEIVFRVDNNLRTLAGGSQAREMLLRQSRALLRDLKALGSLEGNAQRTDLFAKLAQGDVARERGRLDEAYRLFDEAHDHARRQSDADPDNTEWQRDLSVSYNKLGEVAMAAGQLDSALAWFAWGLAERRALADAEPANPRWQRDLSMSYSRLGEVAVAAGQFDDARAWFERSLAVSEALAAADPGNPEWQHDRSVSYSRLGDVAVAAGKLLDARTWFARSFTLSKLLAEADPANAGRQHDLSVSYNKLGNVALAAGKLEDARGWFGRSLALIKLLVEADPANTRWQRDLAVSYDKLGNVCVAAEQIEDARAWFERSLAVRASLVDADPANAGWQRDLSVSYDRLGNACVAVGQLDDARAWFQHSLALSKTLAETDPANASWQADLAMSYDKLGSVAAAAGQLDDARAWFQHGLAVREGLADSDPANTGWRRELATSHDRLGELAAAAHQLDDARAWFQRSLAVRHALAGAEPASAAWQREVAVSYGKLGDLALAAGQLEGAHAWFERNLAASSALAGADPSSAELQHDLATAYDRLGRVALTAGRLHDARAWFARCLAVARPLTELFLGNAQWQRELSATYGNLADISLATGELHDARSWLERSLTMSKTLTGARPAGDGWQRELAIIYRKLGNIAVALGERQDAHAWFERSLATITLLVRAAPTRAELQRDLLIARRDLVRTADLDPAAARPPSEHTAILFDRGRPARALAGGTELAAVGGFLSGGRGG